MTRVGVVGLGRMGAPIATNVSAAGFDVVLWNRGSAKAQEIAASIGATVSSTPRELAENCDVVVTMLSDDNASNSVCLPPDGLFGATDGAEHIISMGTHSPAHVRELAGKSTGAMIIDAPVSGSVAAATAAQLLIMAGATKTVVEPLRPVLDAIGRETICLGSVGSGATMKLVVNMLIHGLNQTMAEALVLADSSGIELLDAYRTIEGSAAAAPMLTYRKDHYLDEPSTPVSFALSLARKDVELAVALAAELDVTLPQTELNLAELRGAEEAGFGDRDMAAVTNYLRGRA